MLGVVTVVVGVFGGVAGVLSLDEKRAKSPDFLGKSAEKIPSVHIFLMPQYMPKKFTFSKVQLQTTPIQGTKIRT